MTNKEDKQTQGEFLLGGRLVPIRREGNVVYARTLRLGEEDTGEAVKLERGDRLVIPAGELVVDSRQIDAYFNPRGAGGYAPVANTIWTWYRIVPEDPEFFLFFFALAKRTDVAHVLWASAIEARDKAREDGGIPRRQGFFNALATAEMAIIALHRSIDMVYELVKRFCPELQVPDSVDKIKIAVQEIRDAFEHINERAQSKINQRKSHPDALTIFNQPDFIEFSVLQYKNHSINLESDVIAALLACREFIMNVIDARVAQSTA